MGKKANSEEKKLEEMTLEETFEGIDGIMEMLSGNDVPLEESIDLYKKGMEMLGHCRAIIDEVEGKLETLEGIPNNEDAQ